MADLLETCTFEIRITETDCVLQNKDEILPYNSIQEVGNFLYRLSKNQLPSWFNQVKELKNFCEVGYEGSEQFSKAVWSPRKEILLKSVPKTLFCHDFKGGYLDDRFVNGTSDNTNYVFRYWSYVDIFVYFSHQLVTVPPIGWINSAHQHGVPILGTLITEWDDGKKLCDTILLNDQRINWFADALSRIAQVHRFDGYLLNIENKLDVDQVQSMVTFIKVLKRYLQQRIGEHSYVIWYDSVTIHGDLKWQNELNDKNYIFFDNCDGIFLNYTWNEVLLQSSVKKAGERLHDVYVGLDVFGRNFYEGGGFNLDKACSLVKKYNLSSAIFAFGWTYEALEGRFLLNDQLFWQKIVEYFNIKPYSQLPFYSNFSTGVGTKTYENGRPFGGTWFNLSNQSLQPSFVTHFDEKIKERAIEILEKLKTKIAEKNKEIDMDLIQQLETEIQILKDRLNHYYRYLNPSLEYCMDDGFSGGGCLKIVPSLLEHDQKYVCLFLLNIPITTSINVKTVSKNIVCPVTYYVVLRTLQGQYKVKYLIDEDACVSLPAEKLVLCKEKCVYESTGWQMRLFTVHEAGVLLEFGVYEVSELNTVFIGEVEMY